MKFHCSVSSHVKIWKIYSDLVIITKETLSEWYKTLALHVRHFFCNNDWLPARYLLIIEHYEIFFVWLFNMHLGWLLYAGCTAFSRPSLPVIFTFASHCDQHGSVLPPGHLLIWVYQRFARERMLKGDSAIRPCDSARLPFRCDHNIQPSRIGIRLMPPGCCFHVWSEIHRWAQRAASRA